MEYPRSAAISRSGITIGGWLTMRYRPSTSSASFESACRLSCVRALSATRCARFVADFSRVLSVPFNERVAVLMAFIRSASDRREYQMSIVVICANSAIRSRYDSTDRSVALRASAGVKPLLRAAIVKLAAMRFTSHSNGPGSVSSKSFRSKSNVRSGDANTPKLERCASPQSCATRPALGVSFRSAAMIFAAPR